jgi:serine/threonine protein kinase/Tol biopolymer transport system component
MRLAPGKQLGPYEITAALGVGGMGEVYRARDTRLERTVAIKILSQLSSDPGRRQRFEREAKAISGLNHPNICVLHDIGHQDGIDYLVMECVEGETLAKRLEKGPLPLEQVLKYGAQIADALDKAHRAGIVHRDLKPANIMLTATGAKLLDFGLAKSASPLVDMAAMTATKAEPPITEHGTIVGTFQYMSPEQVEGRELDGRSDIFSLGAVLYEMVTGQRAFAGKSQLSVASAILEKEPAPITSLRPLTPLALDHAIRTCLAKDPDERWQTGRDLSLELKWIGEVGSQVGAPAVAGRRSSSVRERIAWALAGVCIALLTWFGVAHLRSGPTVREHLHLPLLPPQSTSFVPSNFAISPDGHRLAFVASAEDGRSALWIRSLSAGTAQLVTGTEGAMYPFWSPNNQQVGFFSEGKLKTVDPSGGAVQIVCDAFGAQGGTWNNRGTIVFSGNESGRSSNLQDSSLLKVTATGGTPEPAINTNSTVAFLWPEFLPDGDHFFYFAGVSSGSVQRGIYVASLQSKTSKMVSSDMIGNVKFASGRLFYIRDRSLLAQPFDVKRFQTIGPSEPVVQHELQLEAATSGRVGFSVSDTGVVVFESAADIVSRLAWFDRAGKELDQIPAIGYNDPALSRDGKSLAVSSDDAHNGKRSIHIYDFDRGTSTRVSDGGSDFFPFLSPDGQKVIYQGNDAKHVYVASTDGSSKPESVLEGSSLVIPNDWSPDGRYMVYMDFQSPPPDLAIYDFRTHSHFSFGLGVEGQISPDGTGLERIQGSCTL